MYSKNIEIMNSNEAKNLFNVILRWKEECMATVTVKGDDIECARRLVSENIEDYLDYCINRWETEFLEKEYETLRVSLITESSSYDNEDII